MSGDNRMTCAHVTRRPGVCSPRTFYSLLSLHTYPCQPPLTRVCNGFLRRGMASNLQLGLGFRPGLRQQPDPAPEAAPEQQPPQPVDAVADDADGPYRPAPGVAAPGSRRLGRRAQVAWSNPAVMGVFHPPVVAGGRLWCHRPGPAGSPPTAPASGGRCGPGRFSCSLAKAGGSLLSGAGYTGMSDTACALLFEPSASV